MGRLLNAEDHPISKDVIGALSIPIVALPAVVPAWYAFTQCPTHPADGTWLADACKFSVDHPIHFLNVLSFLSISVAMWIHSVIFSSTWIIDPYWTFAPHLMGFYYRLHPRAEFNSERSLLALGVLTIWSVRLTYNYFRREEWHFGLREDWRFAEFRKRFPVNWWWLSFFAAFFDQQLMLVGAALPLYAVHSTSAPLSWVDFVAAAICIIGVTCEGFADTQLRNFMLLNDRRAREGKPKYALLESGLWYYSRHPNYFGEQAFWWGLWIFAVGVGKWQYGIGALIISALFVGASLDLVEKRMLRKKNRAAVYLRYIETTSAFIPWFKFKPKTSEKENTE